MKRVIALSLAGLLLYGGEIVDKVVAVVGDQPITLYQIKKLSQEQNIPPNRALNLLIDKNLINYLVREKGIAIDPLTLDRAIREIAQRNGMEQYQFEELLKQRGEYQKFIEELKNNLKKEELFKSIVNGRITITPEEVKNYYQTHQGEFRFWKEAEVTRYFAPNPQLLKLALQNPLSPPSQVKITAETLHSSTLPIPVAYIIQQTPSGHFTPIVPEKWGYSIYYIKSKKGEIVLPLQKVQNLIRAKLYREKRNAILQSYFDKMKNSSIVHLLKK
jgi:parvulin-like peptidyl-prolyl isomerase